MLPAPLPTLSYPIHSHGSSLFPRHADAELALNEAHMADPFSAQVEVEAGRLAWSRGDREQTFKHFQRATLLEVNCVDALLEIGDCLLAKVFFIIIKNNNEQTKIEMRYHRSSSFFVCQGRLNKAQSFLDMLTTVDPYSSRGWFLLGKVFEGKQEFDKAADCFMTASQLAMSDSPLPLRMVTLIV